MDENSYLFHMTIKCLTLWKFEAIIVMIVLSILIFLANTSCLGKALDENEHNRFFFIIFLSLLYDPSNFQFTRNSSNSSRYYLIKGIGLHI